MFFGNSSSNILRTLRSTFVATFLLWGEGGELYQKIRLSSVGLAGCAVTVVGWAERLSRCLYPVSSRAF